MPMNIIIQEKRKELGFTQEQVADYLGVSTPAVSKWEKGITSPDIGLLPSLARLLKVDINTLFGFEEDISLQEIGNFCKELAVRAQEDINEAFGLAEAKMHEFPHNEQLLNSVTIVLDAMLLQSHILEDEKEVLDGKVVSWYSRLMQSTDEKIRNSAKYMMVSRYIRQDKLELAQSMLDSIQDRNEMISILPDKLVLQVSIYLKQNKAELAALELEKDLYTVVNRVQLLLWKLMDAELAAGEKHVAESIAEKSMKLAELFDLWKYAGYVASFQIISMERSVEKTVALLEKMLESLTSPWEPEKSALFYRMAPKTKKMESGQMLAALFREIEKDPDCAYLRESQEFQELIAKYKVKESE